MPDCFKKVGVFIGALLAGAAVLCPAAVSSGEQGIGLYYVRYDMKTSKNRLVDTKLTMVPAENEFRAENFSVVPATGAISAGSDRSSAELMRLAKENALKSLLMEKGLKSVRSKDYDTVISWEGAVKIPMKIVDKGFIESKDTFFVKAKINFSPTAFPDRWNRLKFRHSVKKWVSDFMDLLPFKK